MVGCAQDKCYGGRGCLAKMYIWSCHVRVGHVAAINTCIYGTCNSGNSGNNNSYVGGGVLFDK